MGGFGSKLGIGSGGVTRNELLRSTQNSRDFTNKLFQAMITKLTPEDFLKLSKTTSCSTFVFLMADTIQSVFEDLRIRPQRGKDTGIVYFQKVDKLREQTPVSRQLCLIIAYFYIRIFQIFGALAMTIIDDPSAGSTLGVLKYQAPAVQPMGFWGRVPQRVPGARGAILSGGAESKYFIDAALQKYLVIRSIFEDPIDFQVGGTESVKKGFQFTENSNMVFIPKRTGQNMYYTQGDPTTYVLGLFNISNLQPRRDGMYQITVTLSNFNYIDPTIPPTTLRTLNTSYLSKFSFSQRFVSVDKTTWEHDNQSIATVLDTEFQKILKYKDEYIADPSKAVERHRKQVPGAVPGAPGAPGAAYAGAEVGVPKMLQNQFIIQTLKGMAGQKVTAFCVARALQLIDANTLFQPKGKDATSSVCLARFDSLPISVPESGKAISSLPGLKVLDQLYYTNPHVTIKDETAFDKVEPDYTDFLSKMATAFGKTTTAKLSGIDMILAKDPQCPSAAVKHYLRIQDPAGIQKVLGFVNQLFGRQLAHTKAVIDFFKTKLFIIKKARDPATGTVGEYIEIHPRLLQGGIDELSKLSKEARELLVNYYTQCEDIYQKGLQQVLSVKHIVV